MRSAASFVALSAVLALTGCGGGTAARPAQQTAADRLGPAGDYPITVGDPFVIDGVTYTPVDTMNYDAVGYAVDGTGAGVAGGTRTLPYPAYVEVTALDSGKTILVRLDRRGPVEGDGLIELTHAARAQLGLLAQPRSPVRVRRVNPPETERALLRTGQEVPARMDTPAGLLAALKRKLGIVPAAPQVSGQNYAMIDGPSPARPAGPTTRPVGVAPRPVGKPAAQPQAPSASANPATAIQQVPVAASSAPVSPPPVSSASIPPKAGPAPRPAAPAKVTPDVKATATHVVQVGAFSTRDRAETAARQVGGAVSPAGKYWRVQISARGKAQADAALAKARRAGYADARVLIAK